MNFKLMNIENADRNILFSIKKESTRSYVEKIWGWDEEYETADFDKSFLPANYKKIMLDELCIGFIETQEDDNRIDIYEIHIIPAYQGLGIGSEIIKGTIAAARTKNKSTTLGCFKENVRALKLYKSLGFEVYNVTDTHFCLKVSK